MPIPPRPYGPPTATPVAPAPVYAIPPATAAQDLGRGIPGRQAGWNWRALTGPSPGGTPDTAGGGGLWERIQALLNGGGHPAFGNTGGRGSYPPPTRAPGFVAPPAQPQLPKFAIPPKGDFTTQPVPNFRLLPGQPQPEYPLLSNLIKQGGFGDKVPPPNFTLLNGS